MSTLIQTLESALAAFPRYALLHGPTPIQPLARLNASGLLKGVELYVKRDDLTGLGGGGSKLRKLEFLIGEALSQGKDTLLGFGGRQSNVLRLVAAAAAHASLQAELVLSQPMIPDASYVSGGNLFLTELFGAGLHPVPDGGDPSAVASRLEQQLTANGKNVYRIPMGGSNAIAALGYVLAAIEIARQSQVLGINWSGIVLPNGSSASHAGLAVGLKALDLQTSALRAYSVLASSDKAVATTLAMAQGSAASLGLGVQLDRQDIQISDRTLGGGYGIPSADMIAAVKLLASQEGLLLDPVYGGKAFAGLIADINQGFYREGDKVLFIMTGGTHVLHAYQSFIQPIHTSAS